MDRAKLTHLIGQLMNIQNDLESMYKSEIESSELARRFRLPLNNDASALEVACQAIDDAVNVLVGAFPHGQ